MVLTIANKTNEGCGLVKLPNHKGKKMFNLNMLSDILSKIGIEIESNNISNLKLEDDLCVDSQEIVELLADIQDTQGIQTKQVFIRRTDTLQDIVRKVNCLSNSFDYKRTDTVLISCKTDVIKNAIWNVEKWENLLSHIEKIEVISSDDIYQDFLMDVKNERGLLKVQSNRVLVDNKVYFNQPTPPKYLSAHMGYWEFEENGENETLVKLTHKWIISDVAQDYFAEEDSEKISTIIDIELKKHAEETLNMWKGILDATNN